MKKSTYTRTALASLLTLCSFGCFAAEFPSENMREIKKQESTNTSGKAEVVKTSNTKLKEKVDRICNAVPRKKAEEAKKKEDAKLVAEQKKKDEIRLASEKKKAEEIRLANEKSAKLKDDQAKSRISEANAKKAKTVSVKNSTAQDVKDSVKSAVNKSVERKAKANPVVSVGGVDVIDTNQGKSGLRITFGGVVDAQGYGKVGPSGDDYKRYNVMTGRSTKYYDVDADKIKGANPIFPRGIGNIGDYSDNKGMLTDAILHLRAENKNEDLGLLYGADVQFHVPVTEGKGASQGVYAARGRSAHIFVNSEYGDVKLGYQFGPESLMRLDATRIATADGAADSDWFRKVNLEGSAASFPFYVTPRLYTESFSSESEKLSFRMAGRYNKGVMTTLPFRVAYYSPNYMGARFGISYSPRYDSSLFSVNEGSSAINLDSHADDIAGKFIKAGNFSYAEAGKATLADDISKATGSIKGATGATVVDKTAAIEAVATALFPSIKQPVAADIDTAIKKDTAIQGMKPGFDIKNEIDISTLAATKKYDNPDAFKAALTEKINAKNSDYITKDDTGKANVAEAKAAVNAVIKEAVEDLISDLELNASRISATKRKEIIDKVNQVYGNAIVLDAIKNGPHGSSAIKHVGPDYQNIFSAGVSYEYDFAEQNVKVKASAVGEYGQAKESNANKHVYNEYVEYNDLMGVNFGVSADYKVNEDQSAKFAASFAYLGKSGQPKGIKTLISGEYRKLLDTDERVKGLKAQFDGDDKNTMYWTAGAGYQYENAYTSLTYFGSTMNDGDMLHDVALGVQYDLSPACTKSKFVPYAALHYFITDEKQKAPHKVGKSGGGDAPSNQGALLLTGVKFSF
ncbi:WD0745 family porin [Wolbachia endosymbiont of Folsomia candida]|uniref:WD0745 family porin n=1 Tax=Wolbachia endosymbiont of Folsomia candida TaxID=169402 RepID=UPI000B093EA6|nr:hypothetical protein [Wolbachia endosymbiont of Folsomia candida]